LYLSPNINYCDQINGMRWARHVARLGGKTKCMQGIGGKADGTESRQKTEGCVILDGSERSIPVLWMCCIVGRHMAIDNLFYLVRIYHL